MLSRYLHTKERDGVMALFHELHPDPIFCSKQKWEQLIQGGLEKGDDLLSDLKKSKLIISDSSDDSLDFEITVANLERKLNQPTILYLMTAQGCNFNCKYCPVPRIAKKYGESILSTKDAYAGIDLWQQHLAEVYDKNLQYFIIFYGGEPLLNKDTIKDSLGYIRQKKDSGELPRNLSIMIATNGALIDDEIINLCKKYEIMVAVGLDGPKSANDDMKVDILGNGTYEMIISKINLLVKNKIRTFASVSITPSNLEHIAQYSNFFKELGVEKFGFNFLKGQMLLDIVGQDGLMDYYRKASKGVIENARRQVIPSFEYQMEKKQTAFDSRDFFPVDCTCYGNQLVIQPDGQVSNCPFSKTWLGHISRVGKNFRIWNQDVVTNLRKRLPLYQPGEAKAVCGGGCAWSSRELKGDPLAVDDSSKIFSEEVLNEFIWSHYDQLKSQA